MIKIAFVAFAFHLCMTMMAQDTGRLNGFTSSEIPDSVFRRMQGRSFPEGCRVHRSDLRYLRLLHYDGNGKVQ